MSAGVQLRSQALQRARVHQLHAEIDDTFVGRQQIYDADLNVVAYELLFRSGTENRASIVDGDIATSQLLVNAVIEIGLENLVFGRPAFVNFTRNFLIRCQWERIARGLTELSNMRTTRSLKC